MSSGSDLLSHLTPCEYRVDFHGLVFDFPALDTIGWLKLLLAEPFSLYAIFPEKLGIDAVDLVEDLLWSEQATMEQVERTGLDIISAAADRPWWTTLRLIRLARDSWEIIHVNSAQGVPLAGWLDEVWTKTVQHCDPKKLASLRHDLETAPKGFETELDFDAEEQAFLNAMKAVMR